MGIYRLPNGIVSMCEPQASRLLENEPARAAVLRRAGCASGSTTDGFATFSCDRASLESRRSQRSFRLVAGSRLQSRASSLRTDEPNDHAGPNQRPAGEFAG